MSYFTNLYNVLYIHLFCDILNFLTTNLLNYVSHIFSTNLVLNNFLLPFIEFKMQNKIKKLHKINKIKFWVTLIVFYIVNMNQCRNEWKFLKTKTYYVIKTQNKILSLYRVQQNRLSSLEGVEVELWWG